MRWSASTVRDGLWVLSRSVTSPCRVYAPMLSSVTLDMVTLLLDKKRVALASLWLAKRSFSIGRGSWVSSRIR